MIAGCSRKVQPVIEHDTIYLATILHDTIVYSRPDHATITALFRYDSINSKVVMENLDVVAGSATKPAVTFIDSTLTIAITVDSQAVYAAWSERYQVPVAPVDSQAIYALYRIRNNLHDEVVKEPPWYLKALSLIGAASLIAVLIVAIVKIK